MPPLPSLLILILRLTVSPERQLVRLTAGDMYRLRIRLFFPPERPLERSSGDKQETGRPRRHFLIKIIIIIIITLHLRLLIGKKVEFFFQKKFYVNVETRKGCRV